jgi:pilus assembly protein CpaE
MPNLLVVNSDERLAEEVDAALASLDEPRPVTYYVPDMRQGIEAARSRRPELALVEMCLDVRLLKNFVEEMALASPETVVAAYYRPDSFGPEVSESAVFIDAVRAGVKDFLRRPVSSGELGELLRRLLRARAARLAQVGRIGTIVSFISNKGGVGKSTLAVNVATGLALEHPDRVLLVDASVQMGVCASMLDLKPAASISDAIRQQHRLDETLIRQLAATHSSGLHLLAAPANSLEAADLDDEIISRILTLARRAYDYVLVDTFPMLDRINVAVLDLSDRAYLVFENVVPTLQGAVQLVQLLDGLGFSRQRRRVILNRNTTLPGSLRPADVAQRLGHSVDHVLPYDKKVIIAANTGVPFVLRAGRFSQCGRRLRELIADVESAAHVELTEPAVAAEVKATDTQADGEGDDAAMRNDET